MSLGGGGIKVNKARLLVRQLQHMDTFGSNWDLAVLLGPIVG